MNVEMKLPSEITEGTQKEGVLMNCGEVVMVLSLWITYPHQHILKSFEVTLLLRYIQWYNTKKILIEKNEIIII